MNSETPFTPIANANVIPSVNPENLANEQGDFQDYYGNYPNQNKENQDPMCIDHIHTSGPVTRSKSGIVKSNRKYDDLVFIPTSKKSSRKAAFKPSLIPTSVVNISNSSSLDDIREEAVISPANADDTNNAIPVIPQVESAHMHRPIFNMDNTTTFIPQTESVQLYRPPFDIQKYDNVLEPNTHNAFLETWSWSEELKKQITLNQRSTDLRIDNVETSTNARIDEVKLVAERAYEDAQIQLRNNSVFMKNIDEWHGDVNQMISEQCTILSNKTAEIKEVKDHQIITDTNVENIKTALSADIVHLDNKYGDKVQRINQNSERMCTDLNYVKTAVQNMARNPPQIVQGAAPAAPKGKSVGIDALTVKSAGIFFDDSKKFFPHAFVKSFNRHFDKTGALDFHKMSAFKGVILTSDRDYFLEKAEPKETFEQLIDVFYSYYWDRAKQIQAWEYCRNGFDKCESEIILATRITKWANSLKHLDIIKETEVIKTLSTKAPEIHRVKLQKCKTVDEFITKVNDKLVDETNTSIEKTVTITNTPNLTRDLSGSYQGFNPLQLQQITKALNQQQTIGNIFNKNKGMPFNKNNFPPKNNDKPPPKPDPKSIPKIPEEPHVPPKPKPPPFRVDQKGHILLNKFGKTPVTASVNLIDANDPELQASMYSCFLLNQQASDTDVDAMDINELSNMMLNLGARGAASSNHDAPMRRIFKDHTAIGDGIVHFLKRGELGSNNSLPSYLRDQVSLSDIFDALKDEKFEPKGKYILSAGQLELNYSKKPYEIVEKELRKIINLLLEKFQAEYVILLFPIVKPRQKGDKEVTLARYIEYRKIFLRMTEDARVFFWREPAMGYLHTEICQKQEGGQYIRPKTGADKNILPNIERFKFIHRVKRYYPLITTYVALHYLMERKLDQHELIIYRSKHWTNNRGILGGGIRNVIAPARLILDDNTNRNIQTDALEVEEMVNKPTILPLPTNTLNFELETETAPQNNVQEETNVSSDTSIHAETKTQPTLMVPDMIQQGIFRRPHTTMPTRSTRFSKPAVERSHLTLNQMLGVKRNRVRYEDSSDDDDDFDHEAKELQAIDSIDNTIIDNDHVAPDSKAGIIDLNTIDPTCVVSTLINTRNYALQLDSGALPNVISKEVLKDIIYNAPGWWRFLHMKRPVLLKMADNNIVKTHQNMVEIKMFFGTEKIKVPFYLIESPGRTFIMGRATMDDLRVVLDIHEKFAECKPMHCRKFKINFMSRDQFQDALSVFSVREYYTAFIHEMVHNMKKHTKYAKLDFVSINEQEQAKKLYLENLKSDLEAAVSSGSVTQEEATQGLQELEEFGDIFSLDPGRYRGQRVKFRFKPGDEHLKPWRGEKFRPSKKIEPALRTAIRKMLAKGIIRPSHSSYINTVVPVIKKNGDIRLCLDADELNKFLMSVLTEPNPIKEVIFDNAGDKFFCTLDFTAGFWQLVLEEASCKFTAFQICGQVYEFTRLPYGLKISSGEFVHMINQVIENEEGISKFVDDIKVSGTTFRETLNRLKKVFTKIRENGLKLNPTKTQFFREKTDHLGFVISKEGIGKQVDKMKKLNDFEKKHTKKGVFKISKKNDALALVGHTGLYSDFIPRYSQIVNPIYLLTKDSDPVEWKEEQAAAFELLKAEYKKDFKLQQPPRDGDLYLDTDITADAMNEGEDLSEGEEEVTDPPLRRPTGDIEDVDMRNASETLFRNLVNKARDERAIAREKQKESEKRTIMDPRVPDGKTITNPTPSTSSGADAADVQDSLNRENQQKKKRDNPPTPPTDPTSDSEVPVKRTRGRPKKKKKPTSEIEPTSDSQDAGNNKNVIQSNTDDSTSTQVSNVDNQVATTDDVSTSPDPNLQNKDDTTSVTPDSTQPKIKKSRIGAKFGNKDEEEKKVPTKRSVRIAERIKRVGELLPKPKPKKVKMVCAIDYERKPIEKPYDYFFEIEPDDRPDPPEELTIEDGFVSVCNHRKRSHETIEEDWDGSFQNDYSEINLNENNIKSILNQIKTYLHTHNIT
ncbi:unnamed protein product [Allacma fusca]|uniref:Reverse transcriptase domain-containing protein n=1 Tax=Allacma fusca TaxID=39272 RepID=A0A8J2KCH3_9HEXA|nr:unnamed protein product [Allacma fusca]